MAVLRKLDSDLSWYNCFVWLGLVINVKFHPDSGCSVMLMGMAYLSKFSLVRHNWKWLINYT